MRLRPYQIRAKNFWLEQQQVYLAIDMGLGKTAIVLHAVNELELPALVVAPLKVTYNTWPEEIKDWDLDGDVTVSILHGPNKDQAFKTKAQVHVINYDGLPWLYKKLYKLHKAGKPMPYKVLVLDESTYIKDYTSNRFGLLCAMRDMFTHVVNLSGTPSPNSLMDLWAQYYILDKGETLGKDYRVFRAKFFEQDTYRKYKWNPRFGAEDTIYKLVAGKTFRLQSDDYIDLPKRIFNKISLEFPAKERKQYESFKKDFVLLLDQAKVASLNEASLNSKLRQFVQGSVYENFDDGGRRVHFIHNIKVAALRHLIETNSGKNFICLVQFQFEIDMLLKEFPEAPFITGATKTADGNKALADWNRGKVPLLFAHPRSVGVGLNLQKGGHNLVWYALTYSLFDYLQTNKRLHRSGQVSTVVIHHLIMRGTIDELVFKALNTKGMTQDKFLLFLREETKRRYGTIK